MPTAEERKIPEVQGEAWILAIDLGACSCVVAVRRGDGPPEVLGIDGSQLVPSLVAAGSDGRVLVGRGAEIVAASEAHRAGPLPLDRIAEVGPVTLAGDSRPASELIEAAVASLVGAAEARMGGPPVEVRLVHPGSWSDAQVAALVEIARRAGIPDAVPVAAPVAVAGTVGGDGPVAVVDLGGRASVHLVRRAADGGWELTGPGWTGDGGRAWDQLVADRLWAKLDDDTLGDVLCRVGTEWVEFDAQVTDAARAAREELSASRRASARLPVPAGRPVDLEVDLEELYELLLPSLLDCADALRAALASAGPGSAGLASAGTGSAGTGSAGTGSAGTGSAGTASAGTASTGTASTGTGGPGPAVALVGGASTMPLARRLVGEAAGGVVRAIGDPRTAAALGAAAVPSANAGIEGGASAPVAVEDGAPASVEVEGGAPPAVEAVVAEAPVEDAEPSALDAAVAEVPGEGVEAPAAADAGEPSAEAPEPPDQAVAVAPLAAGAVAGVVDLTAAEHVIHLDGTPEPPGGDAAAAPVFVTVGAPDPAGEAVTGAVASAAPAPVIDVAPAPGPVDTAGPAAAPANGVAHALTPGAAVTAATAPEEPAAAPEDAPASTPLPAAADADPSTRPDRRRRVPLAILAVIVVLAIVAAVLATVSSLGGAPHQHGSLARPDPPAASLQ